jgi:hypothetical protein
MRMLMKALIPHERFNAYVKDGSIAQKLNRVLEETKPEAVYFTNMHGQRCAILIVDLPEPSKVPALAEPWFLLLNADVEFHIVMDPEDLKKAGLEAIGKKWA